MTVETRGLETDFRNVAKLAGIHFFVDVRIEPLCAPHNPPARLPDGSMAVYAFFYHGCALKIGKAGPNSGARYTTQHYNLKAAQSTLAKTLLRRGTEIGVKGLTELSVGDWIKANTDRYNFLLDSSYPIRLLTLLEAFLQCKFNPVFEGSSSQT